MQNKSLNPRRSQELNRFIVGGHFDKVKIVILIEHCNIFLKVKMVRQVFLEHFKIDFGIWVTSGTLYAKGGPQATVWKSFYKKNEISFHKMKYI